MLFKGSRKGLSPLIATVLLIAFAVAMGAMIMNWSSSVGDSLGGPDCSGMRIILSPAICLSEGMIKIGLKNDGQVIEQLSVKVSDDVIDTEYNLKSSRLRKGDVINTEIPYSKSGKTALSITPLIEKDGELVPCDTPTVTLDDVKEC